MRKKKVTAGIDLGGTSTRVGLLDEEMNLLACCSIATRVAAGPEACVGEMAETLQSLQEEFDAFSLEITGLGIGSPGPIDLVEGVLGVLPNLPGWEDFPLRASLSWATGLPVVLESDANAAAVAEWKLGAGRSVAVDSMACITLGTGVGSGLILNGRVWHGMSGMAGEIGHATIDPQGALCNCGTRGCLECYASANGVVRLAREIAASSEGTAALRALVAHADRLGPSQIAALADQGDPAALEVFVQMGRFLGIGIANLISTLDLPMVVIGGGVAGAWSLFSSAMFRAVADYSVVYRLVAPGQQQTREQQKTFVCPAELGAAAGLLGAGLLPTLA